MIEIHHVGVVSKDLDSALRYFQIDKSQIDEIIDDDKKMHYRSIDGVSIISSVKALEYLFDNNLKFTLSALVF